MAWPLNRIATTDLQAAWMKKYGRANITGHGPETALVSSVSGSLASFPAWRPWSRAGARGFRPPMVAAQASYTTSTRFTRGCEPLERGHLHVRQR